MAVSNTMDEFAKNAETITNLNTKTIEQATRKATELGSTLLNQKDWDGILKAQAEFVTETSNLALEYSRQIMDLATKPFSSMNKSFSDSGSKSSAKK